MLDHVNIDAMPGCNVDSAVTAGPRECSGPTYVTHMVYADAPGTCYDATICLAHVPWAWMFQGTELDNYTRRVLEARMEPS